jgi:hypothetical protein
MAKRFTDTNKWNDVWFSQLPNDYKLVWIYMLDTCDNAGIWLKNIKNLNFFCNTNLTEEDLKQIKLIKKEININNSLTKKIGHSLKS